MEYLAWEICKLDIIYNKKNLPTQDQNFIYIGSHYIDALHEISLWLVSPSEFRGCDNLGIPYDGDPLKEDHPRFCSIQEDEQIATALTSMLYEKYLNEFYNPREDYELKQYMEFLNECCDAYSGSDARKIARDILDSYTEFIANLDKEFPFTRLEK